MIKIKYKKFEKEKMIESGYPICMGHGKDSRHCNTCIKEYRKRAKNGV